MPHYARVFLLPDGGVPVRVPLARYEAMARGEVRLPDLAGTTGLFAIASMERGKRGTWEVLRVDGARFRFDRRGHAEEIPQDVHHVDLARRPGRVLREDAPLYRGERQPDPVLTKVQRAAVTAAALLSRPR